MQHLEAARAQVRCLLEGIPVTFDGQPLDLFASNDPTLDQHLLLNWGAVLDLGSILSPALVGATLSSVVDVCGQDPDRWATLIAPAPGFAGTVGELLDVVAAASGAPAQTSAGH